MKGSMDLPPLDLPPLADLHRHLDGSLRRDTLLTLADALGIAVPDALCFHPGMGLQEALARFAVTLSVLQTPAAVERVAAEICEDAAADGVTTLEIRFAPQLHRAANVEEIVDAACSGAAGRAGVILCGLYGEPPATLDELVVVGAPRAGVVGIDLAGGPSPGQRFQLADYAPAFQRAKELGLGRTVHAGEGRPPREIRLAIELLHAQRIGHGTTLLGDPKVVELVLERGITIETCPTSNWHTGVIAQLADHPLPRFLQLGVQACVCPDNTLLSDVSSSVEHQRAAAIPAMTPALIERAIANGHRAAFGR